MKFFGQVVKWRLDILLVFLGRKMEFNNKTPEKRQKGEVSPLGRELASQQRVMLQTVLQLVQPSYGFSDQVEITVTLHLSRRHTKTVQTSHGRLKVCVITKAGELTQFSVLEYHKTPKTHCSETKP